MKVSELTCRIRCLLPLIYATEEQRQMSERLSKLAAGTCYHENAGEASAFLALAHRKISASGTLALVMPLTLQFGRELGAVAQACCESITAISVPSALRPDGMTISRSPPILAWPNA